MWHVWSLETACKKQERVVRRRHRLVISCARCRRLKVKCDRQSPCEHCKKSNHADECVYSAPRFDRRSEETDKSTDESRTEKSPESPESTLMTSKRGLYCSGPSIESWKNDTLRIKLSIPRLNAAMYSYPDKATMWLSKFRGETHWAVHMNEVRLYV